MIQFQRTTYSMSDIFESLFSDRIIAFTSDRRMGDMALKDKTGTLSETHNRFLKSQGFSADSLVLAKQNHGNNIVHVTEDVIAGLGPKSRQVTEFADALLTCKAGVILGVLTADCPAVFLFDTETPAIGLVHAGWKGLQKDIVGKTIKQMMSCFNTSSRAIHIGVSPFIRDCCYRVGPEFLAYFPGAIQRRKEILYCNLASVIKNQTLSLGVRPEHLHLDSLCTQCCSEHYFSLRSEGSASGRMLSCCAMLPKSEILQARYEED